MLGYRYLIHMRLRERKLILAVSRLIGSSTLIAV